MATAVVRMEAWGDPHRTQFEVRFDPADLALWPADSGCHLHINVEMVPDGTKIGGPYLLAVQGTLRVADTSSQAGIEVPMQPLGPNYRTLRIPMTTADIVRIESRRGDAEQFMCSINLSGLANVVVGEGRLTMAVHGNMASPFSIGRERWLAMLNNARHGWTRLVELPALANPGALEWAVCTTLLERATAEYRNHASESAIATCRLVLEAMVEVVAKRWSVPRRQGQSMEGWLKELEGRLAATWPEDAGAAKVLTGMYAALWSWTSEAHHVRSRVPLHQEAAFAIGLTADLLTHAGHLLAVHPNPVVAAPAAVAQATNGQETTG